MQSSPYPKLPQLSGGLYLLGQHDQYPWKPLPWKGTFTKVLAFDYLTGATIELAKYEKGALFPEHYHTTVQTFFLVSGRLRTGAGDIIEPGTFNIIPAGQVHGSFYGEEESIQIKFFSSTPVYILKDGTVYIYRSDGSTIDAGNLAFAPKITTKNFITP